MLVYVVNWPGAQGHSLPTLYLLNKYSIYAINLPRTKSQRGAGYVAGIKLFNLVEAILQSWKTPAIELQGLRLSKENIYGGYSEAGFRYFY